jgi:hypothetical protein
MSDKEKTPEPQHEQPADKISDLPEKPITDQDAHAVKGGATKHIGNVKYE